MTDIIPSRGAVRDNMARVVGYIGANPGCTRTEVAAAMTAHVTRAHGYVLVRDAVEAGFAALHRQGRYELLALTDYGTACLTTWTGQAA